MKGTNYLAGEKIPKTSPSGCICGHPSGTEHDLITNGIRSLSQYDTSNGKGACIVCVRAPYDAEIRTSWCFLAAMLKSLTFSPKGKYYVGADFG